jgi:transposase
MTVPLLPDALWNLIEPLLPVPPPRPNGGRPRVPDRACLTGILFVLRRSTQDLNLIDAEKHQGAPNDIEPQRGDKRTHKGMESFNRFATKPVPQ